MSRSKISLAFGLVFSALVVLSLGTSRADEEEAPYPVGPQAGRDLAAKLRGVHTEENITWHGFLKIFGRGHKVPPIPITCESITTSTNWTVTYQTATSGSAVAEKLTIIYATNGPNQYLYARAASTNAPLGEQKLLTGAEADIPLAGSDFWLSDLGLEFLHWPEQDRLKGEMRSSRPCYVLVSSNPHPAANGYSRVKTWVEKESGQPLEAKAYRTGNTNDVYKSYSLGSVVKVNSRYQVKDLRISNGSSRTELENDVEGKP